LYVLVKEDSALDKCHTKHTDEMGNAALHRMFILIVHPVEVLVLH